MTAVRSNQKVCILLTGTIEPKNVPNLKRIDPVIREEDYYHTIKRWMKLDYPVLFVENSNYESTKIKGLFNGRDDCEYIRFESKVSYLGKSHGEAEIIDFALKNSEVLTSSQIIIKSSGRQFVANALNILSNKFDGNIYVISWLKRNLQYADSRFFIARKEFYSDYLSKEFLFINESDGVYFEHVLARAIHRCLADGKNWAYPGEYPVCEGVSGTEDIKYKVGLFNRIKGNVIISLTNRLLKNDYL